MICFKTQLKLKIGTAADDIWQCIKDWRNESKNTLPDLKKWLEECPKLCTDKKSVKSGNKKQTVETIYLEEDELFSFTLEETQENKRHTTRIIFNGNCGEKRKSYISCEMSAENDEGRKNVPFSSPKIFQKLKKKQFLDEKAAYRDVATPLAEIDESRVANLIDGNVDMALPFVYVSNSDASSKSLADTLAKKLFCLAFVCYETDSNDSKKIKTERKPPYNGAVGVYWKDNYRIFTEPDEKKIVKEICLRLAVKPLREELSWKYVADKYSEIERLEFNEKIEKSKKRIEEFSKEVEGKEKVIEELKDQIKTLNDRIKELAKEKENLADENEHEKEEKEEYINEFDSEISQLRSENEKLEKEKTEYKTKSESLQAQLNSKSDSDSDDGIYIIPIKCSEKELFPGEITDFVKGVLYNGIKGQNVPENQKSRRKDIVDCLKNENSDFEYIESNSYKKYQELETKIKAGKIDDCKDEFIEQNHKNHKKYIFYNDSRYAVTQATTPSDWREDENVKSKVSNICFLEPN